jgi:cell division septal protein FtsQ
MRRDSRDKKLKKYWLLLVPTIGLIVVCWQMFPRLFTITHIECFTQQGTCDSQYLEQLNLIKGQPLLWTLPKFQVDKELGNFKEIGKIDLHRRLPNTLIVNIFQRKAIGLIIGNVLGENIAVDSSGYAYAPLKSESLPILTTNTFTEYPSVLDTSTSQAILILSQAQNLFDQPLHGLLDNTSLVINTNLGSRIVFDINNLPDNWHYSLQIVLSRSKMSAKIPQIIDLRYTDPILTY